jgi:hypothetical protein
MADMYVPPARLKVKGSMVDVNVHYLPFRLHPLDAEQVALLLGIAVSFRINLCTRLRGLGWFDLQAR